MLPRLTKKPHDRAAPLGDYVWMYNPMGRTSGSPGRPPSLALWCAMLVVFYAFLRKCHLCVDGVGLGELATAVLRRKHFALDPVKYCVIIQVGVSKTNQFGERCHEVTLQGVKGHLLDPYYWLQQLFSSHPADGEAPAFGHVDAGGRYVPLSYQSLLSGMKKAVQAAGMNPAAFAGHSLRRGGATWAFQCGVQPLFIRIQGDWHSDAWLLYIALSEEQQITDYRLQSGPTKGAPVTEPNNGTKEGNHSEDAAGNH